MIMNKWKKYEIIMKANKEKWKIIMSSKMIIMK